MAYNDFKCPNCGANLKINKLKKIGKCEYCSHEVIYDLQEDELSKLIEGANAHLKLKDTRNLKRDSNILYEKYPGNPMTYYYLAKADLLEIQSLINNKNNASRCNYLLSCVHTNLSRLHEFNKDNDMDASDIINEYNGYVEVNNRDMKRMVRNIIINNIVYISLLVLIIIITVSLCFTDLLFLAIVLIMIEFFASLPKRILKKVKHLPSKRDNPKY